MERWLTIPRGQSVVALSNNNEVVGLGCRRPAFQGGTHLIGPVYAADAGIARDLVAGLTRDLDTQNDTIWINIWSVTDSYHPLHPVLYFTMQLCPHVFHVVSNKSILYL